VAKLKFIPSNGQFLHYSRIILTFEII